MVAHYMPYRALLCAVDAARQRMLDEAFTLTWRSITIEEKAFYARRYSG
jgi:hypothetical protein